MPEQARNNATMAYDLAIDLALQSYQTLLAIGVAPEQARFVLPQGVYTEWYWTGSLAAYARFVNQRSSSYAQKEIQVYAEMIKEIMFDLFPVSSAALTGNPLLTQ